MYQYQLNIVKQSKNQFKSIPPSLSDSSEKRKIEQL